MEDKVKTTRKVRVLRWKKMGHGLRSATRRDISATLTPQAGGVFLLRIKHRYEDIYRLVATCASITAAYDEAEAWLADWRKDKPWG